MDNISKYIDLHTHSTASDGSCSPGEVAALAKSADLSTIALTDHDTMSGVDECVRAGKEIGVGVISGVEMSCVYNGKEIHILGYLFKNFKNNIPISMDVFTDLNFFAKERADRNEEIIRRFAKDNIFIKYEDLTESNPNTQITRAHFSNALIKMGLVKTKKEAFERYLEYGGKYIPLKGITTKRCMDFLNKHKFFISLAHPVQYKFTDDELEDLLKHLISQGLGGIEVFHSTHSDSDMDKFLLLSKKYNLFPTGGSDFHGANKEGLYIGKGYGNLKIPKKLLDDILENI